MLSRSILLLLAASAATSTASNTGKKAGDSRPLELSEQEKHEFRQLLNLLPEESIETALKSHLDHYRKGIFDHDRKAIERVHDNDPPLATKLISAAALEAYRMELVKRQTPTNASASTSDVPPTSTPPASDPPTSAPPSSEAPSSAPPSSVPPSSKPPSSSVLPSIQLPTEITTTDDAGSTVVTTSSIYVMPTASVEVPITTTDDEGNTYTTSVYNPGVVITKTNSAGSPVVITSAIPSSFLTDLVPEASSKVVYVTTLPDGEVSTITTYEIVTGDATGVNGNGPDATRTKPAPGVQTNAGNIINSPWLAEAAALVACAAVFTIFL